MTLEELEQAKSVLVIGRILWQATKEILKKLLVTILSAIHI